LTFDSSGPSPLILTPPYNYTVGFNG